MVNQLVGKHVTDSGLSLGGGKTQFLKAHCDDDGIVYCDTPGLSDAQTREQAGKKIQMALSLPIMVKLVFVLTLESGRVKPQDTANIQQVVESIKLPNGESMRANYGVIINKIEAEIADALNEEGTTGVEACINAKNPTPTGLFLMLTEQPKARNKKDVLLPQNPKLTEWLMTVVPSLPSDKIVTEIKQVDDKQIKELEAKMKQLLEASAEEKRIMQGELERLKEESRIRVFENPINWLNGAWRSASKLTGHMAKGLGFLNEDERKDADRKLDDWFDSWLAK